MNARTVQAFSDELRKIASALLGQPQMGVVNQVPQVGAKSVGAMKGQMRMPRPPTVGLPSVKV